MSLERSDSKVSSLAVSSVNFINNDNGSKIKFVTDAYDEGLNIFVQTYNGGFQYKIHTEEEQLRLLNFLAKKIGMKVIKDENISV